MGGGSKVHLACDSRGIVGAVCLTAGQINECTMFQRVMDAIAIPTGHGPPRQRPVAAAGDKGYSARPIRRATYRRRNIVERTTAWRKELRCIATRAETLATHYAAMIIIALISRYADWYSSDAP